MNSTYTAQQQADAFFLWFFIFAAIGAVVCAGIGYAIGNAKGRASEGLVLGLLLGIIGVIIIAVMSDRNADMTRMVEASRQRSGPGWHPDPFHRHEMRYFDGFIWSDNVSDGGVTSADPIPDSAQATVLVPSTVTVPDAFLPSRPRKWDKDTKQWLRQDPSGQWIPEIDTRTTSGGPDQPPSPPIA